MRRRGQASFDELGRDLFAVTAFDTFFRSELTRGGPTIQPSVLSEC